MIFFLLALILIFLVLVKRLAGKSISDMTYLVLSGMLNLNSINQFLLFVANHDSCGFRFDASDIALLLAVAGTHSPDLLLSLTENQLPKCGPAL